MLLTLSTTYAPATDLGYLLYKNPARPQSFDLVFGTARVLSGSVGGEGVLVCVSSGSRVTGASWRFGQSGFTDISDRSPIKARIEFRVTFGSCISFASRT